MDGEAGSSPPAVPLPDLVRVLQQLFLSRALTRAVPEHGLRAWPVPRSSAVPLAEGILDAAAVCAATMMRAPSREHGGGSSEFLATSPHLPGGALARGVTAHRWLAGAVGRPVPGSDPAPPWGPIPSLGLPGPFPFPGIAVQVLAGMTLPQQDPDGSPGTLHWPAVGVVVAHRSALTSGAVHEGFNLAAVRRSALVLVLGSTEDGPPGEGSPPRPELDDVAEAYGVRAVRASALDIPILLGELGRGLASVRRGEGPLLMEVDARPGEDGIRDPLTVLRDRVIRARDADAATVAELEEDARLELDEAIRRISNPTSGYIGGTGPASPPPEGASP